VTAESLTPVLSTGTLLTELSTGGLAWTVDVNPKPLDRAKVAINTGAANGNFIV
jgi:hypothetical protein